MRPLRRGPCRLPRSLLAAFPGDTAPDIEANPAPGPLPEALPLRREDLPDEGDEVEIRRGDGTRWLSAQVLKVPFVCLHA